MLGCITCIIYFCFMFGFVQNQNCNRNHNCSVDENYIESNGFLCYCDESCHLYGDCCKSVPMKRKIDVNVESKWNCVLLRFQQKTFGIHMISKCPSSWKTKSIEEKCTKVVPPKKDPFLSIPIFSRLTELTYKNLYCAVCNDDADFSEPWIVYTRCRTNHLKGNCSSSVLYFEPPRTKNFTFRECQRSDINECPNNWTRSGSGNIINSKCHLYNNHFWLESHRITVKNEYCAICNNITLDKLECPLKKVNSVENEGFTSSKFSYAMIIDIDFINGGSVVGTKFRCSRNYVYDPWKKMCRLVTCEKNLRFSENKCVPLHGVGNHNRVPSCPKLLFDPAEYSLQEDGRVIIMSRNKTLQLHEYSIDVGNGKLSICASLDEISLVAKFTDLEAYLSIFGISVSISSLTAKIATFFLKPEPRRAPNMLVLFLSISVLVAQTLFLFGVRRTSYPLLCKLIGITMHYFFLASFFWMNALSFDIYCTFGNFLRSLEKKSILTQIVRYSLYGWLSPAIIVSAAIICEHYKTTFSPNYGTFHCWISNRIALLLFFAIPISVLLLINIGLFLKTAFKIYGVTKEAKLARENVKQKDKNRFILYTKLALIMGVTWLFGFIAPYANNVFIWSLFIVCNSLQGFYIFIAFTQFKVGDVLSKFCKFSFKAQSASTASVTTKM